MRRVFLVLVLPLFQVSPGWSEPLLGLWLTAPDRKGQVAHIHATPCGASLCGTILRTFDRQGNPVTTPNLGKRVFWDMQPTAPGRYEGRGWLPLKNMQFDGQMHLQGNKLTVRGCIGPLCQSQIWTRVPG